MNESTSENARVCVGDADANLVSLAASLSGTLQVRTGNCWTRRGDEKTVAGIKWVNLNISALSWHTFPPRVLLTQPFLFFELSTTLETGDFSLYSHFSFSEILPVTVL